MPTRSAICGIRSRSLATYDLAHSACAVRKLEVRQYAGDAQMTWQHCAIPMPVFTSSRWFAPSDRTMAGALLRQRHRRQLRCSCFLTMRTSSTRYSVCALKPARICSLRFGVAFTLTSSCASSQFGSVAIAWAALQESLAVAAAPTAAPTAPLGSEQTPSSNVSIISASAPSPDSSAEPPPPPSVSIFMLSNATLTPTRLFWSPGLTPAPPVFVRSFPPAPPATYSRVVIVQPATETWWWNVWRRDLADRRAALSPLAARLAVALLPSGSKKETVAESTARAAASRPEAAVARAAVARAARGSASGGDGAGGSTPLPSPSTHRGHAVWPQSEWALILSRSPRLDRCVLNEADLTAAISPVVTPYGLVASLVDLSTLDVRAQLALIRRTGLLIGAHGAGLLWNLFLPPDAPVVELLNRANANEYYSNHCRWSRRPYAAWQNNDTSAEEPAIDPLTKAPLPPFRSHVRVDVAAVASVVRGVLGSGYQGL